MSIQNRIQNYFLRNVQIFNFAAPAWLWFLSLVGAIVVLAAFAYAILDLGMRQAGPSEFMVYFFFGGIAVLFLLLFSLLIYSLFPNYKPFLIFTLIISAICFSTNSYVLNHEVFPPFTERTVWVLWISFFVLTLSFFMDKIPSIVLPFFQPILILGVFVSTSFALVLAPLMIFSWALVWMAGLGFLPYGPLFAITAFGQAIFKIHSSLENSHKKISSVLILTTTVLFISYSAYYFVQWNHAEQILSKPETIQGNNRIDGDLPSWVQKASRLRVNHVTEMVLQPDRGSQLGLFAAQTQFDPLAYFASQGFVSMFRTRSERISGEDAGKMLHLLFGQSHAHLERLWRGNSLITTDIDSHVQIHPELRVSYTETTLSVYNENSSSNRPWIGFGSAFATPEEAIYTITVPEGSICTKLSLWIDGEERPARLTFRSKAHNAYRTIVGTERRDPSYVEWLDGNRLRLKIFPVDPQNYRMVRIGIVSPLKAEKNKLIYERIRFEGPVSDFADQNVNVDLFSKAPIELDTSGISLKEKIVSDSQVRQWTGSAGFRGWSFSIPATGPSGTISAAGVTYNVSPLKKQAARFEPDKIVVALNSALSRSEWKNAVRKIYSFGIPVTILTNEWFQTNDVEKAIRYLDECEIPSFNLFPIHLEQLLTAKVSGKNPLWVTAGETQSIPLGELRGSERFEGIQTASSKRSEPVKIAVLNGKHSEYVASLIDLNQVVSVAENEEELYNVLKYKSANIPVDDENEIALPYSGLTLEKSDKTKETRPGSDLLIRMAIQRKIMKQLGKRFFDRDLENGDLVDLAKDAMVVSPVSTLIVLETERDYTRFGINANSSALGQSKLEAPGAVPEPEEWLLFVCIVFGAIFYWKTKKRYSLNN
ncbi:XrtN system VIT domain-containing protein [Leptospira kmetyi]|uniref:XrtN system VIT domain-containing protein n=1 Tax=Leptospira kmetyi TaxID=408139 RepID=UPI0010848C0D|nr:XrtN system VIT domain-containing protein [Leptospira kmetyi]TGK16934.1 XrtN system VIT domain-containing protein [Leptospira kmetyi]TGK32975.1 XrtN system VIT domain-containing protein [Leptospira kmetyi]